MSRSDFGDFRIGGIWYKVADNEQFFAQTGLRGVRRTWRSLFAERQGVPGSPGVQNLREDDLRWLQDSWVGGEGYRVVDPGDDASFRRYERSVGVDLVNPGEVRLARALAQVGSSGGGASTTIQGNTFVDVVGTSTDVGNDTRLNAVGDIVRADASLANGTYQVDYYAYMDPLAVIEGNTFVQVTPTTHNVGSDKFLDTEGAVVEVTGQDPLNFQTVVTFSGWVNGGGDTQPITLYVTIRDNANDNVIVSKLFVVTPDPPLTDVAWSQALTFTAAAGKAYKYRIKASVLSPAQVAKLDKVTVDEQDAKTLLWELRDTASTVFASGEVDLQGIQAAGTIVASTSIQITGGPLTRRFRFTRQAGASRKMLVDKVVYSLVTLNDPRLVELGKGDRFWLLDFSASASPSVLVYDAQNNEWDAVGNIGPSAAKGICQAHSDSFEFFALDNKIVYRANTPAVVAQYTVAATDMPAGIAVGGNRLLILTESQASGSQLFSVPLEGTPNVALGTAVYVVGNAGISAPNVDEPHRMAGTKNGCVFFCNQGPDCWVYQWDGVAGVAVNNLPRGFRGEAIAHGIGITTIAGSLPAPDSDGTTRRRPAVFQLGPDGVPVELDVRLWRDGDPSTKVVGIQLYGTAIHVQTDLAAIGATNRRMRWWRISLRAPVAAFCEQEVITDQSQATANAGGLAINHRDRVMIWRKGNPYVARETYPTSGYGSLVSSRYAYGVAETKQLIGILVVGQFPAGTSAEVWYATDDGTFALAQSFVASGGVQIATPDVRVPFKYLQTELRLRTTDATKTPVVFSIDPISFCQIWERTWDALLLCADQTSLWHLDSKQVSGGQALAALFSLANEGGLVELEDNYSSRRAEDREVHFVTVESPDAYFMRRGEALVRVKLRERAVA